MTYVLILSGGSGTRFGSKMPKQYVEVSGKPIIAYTLQSFQKNNNIDGIYIVCQNDFISDVNNICQKYGITKFAGCIVGGNTGFESTRNGVAFLHNKLSDNDFVIIHDAVRPIVPTKIINNVVECAYKYGNACSATNVNETIILTNDGISSSGSIERSTIRKVQTPQCYQLKELVQCFEEAAKNNIRDSVYMNTLMVSLGHKIYFSEGIELNIKITKRSDIHFFKYLLDIKEDDLV